MVDIITNQDESGESDNKVTITEIIALLMKSSNHVNISVSVCPNTRESWINGYAPFSRHFGRVNIKSTCDD